MLSKFHKEQTNNQESLNEDHEEEQAMVVKGTIYLDSAATSHMMNQLDWLEDFEDIQGASIKVGNGTKLEIKGKGSMPLSIETEDGTIEYEAVNVLYIPELTDTLISIGEIAREGHKVIFDKNALRVELEKGDSFMVERSRGMYAPKAIPRIIDEQALVNKTKAIDKASLWHYQLAHPGRNITRQLGFDTLGSKCKACKMVKSH